MNRKHFSGVALVLSTSLLLVIAACSNEVQSPRQIPSSTVGSSTRPTAPSVGNSPESRLTIPPVLSPSTFNPTPSVGPPAGQVDCNPIHFADGVWGTGDIQVGDPDADTQTQIVSVGYATHDRCDRFVIRIKASEGTNIHAVARYTTQPIVNDPRGDVISVVGGAKLHVVIGTHANDWMSRGGVQTLPSSSQIASWPVLRDIQFAGNWEGLVSFGVGVVDRNGFRLWRYYEPSDQTWRIVLDVLG